ncbi:MAG: hypothetical protein Kow0062_17480 [Acidobacteriota bacterium]
MGSSAAGSPRSRSSRRLVSQYLEEARRIHRRLGDDTDGTPGPEEGARADGVAQDADDLDDYVRALVEPHLFYVVQVAGEYYSRDIAFEDLLAEGNMGLVEAAHRFDPRHNVKFLTYASWWIRKRILDFLAREGQPVRLTRYAREQRRDLRQHQNDLRSRLGREPTVEELAEVAGVGVRKVREQLASSVRVCSLDQTVHPESDVTLGETIPDERLPDPEEAAGRGSTRRRMLRELARLPERERVIIANRFGFDGRTPMTFQELGDLLGVSRERARQIEREAIQRLRRRLRLGPPHRPGRPSRPGTILR